MAYVDTSALVPCYCPEALSATAEREVRRSGPPTISPLIEVEFCSALARKTRIGEMTGEEARRILSLFRMHCAEGAYRIVPIEARAYAVAGGWLGAFSTPLRTLDALHLAAAYANGLTLVTADRNLAHSAAHFAVQCRFIG